MSREMTITGKSEAWKAMPETLHVEGEWIDFSKPTVAIVGARFCSEYGRYMARQYGKILGEEGFNIITDMSLGIGGISARAAVDAGTSVYAVLGCGVDVCYPPENIDLRNAIRKSGGVISEHEDGTFPTPDAFENRHKIIAGLVDSVIVIEARRKSGTLKVAEYALEIGKKVFAVPGRVTDRLSDGTNELIKSGATMTTCPEDVVSAMQYL